MRQTGKGNRSQQEEDFGEEIVGTWSNFYLELTQPGFIYAQLLKINLGELSQL